jgi:NAD dependent epimerase/dehydratase family enzyme
MGYTRAEFLESRELSKDFVRLAMQRWEKTVNEPLTQSQMRVVYMAAALVTTLMLKYVEKDFE